MTHTQGIRGTRAAPARPRAAPAGQPPSDRLLRWLRALSARTATGAVLLGQAAQRAWERLGLRAGRGVAIQVIVADGRRRRTLERALRRAVGQLRVALGPSFPGSDRSLAVVAQQALCAGGPAAGQFQLIDSPGGKRLVLVRLALEVGGRALGTDEVLAALAEQCVGLAAQPDARPGGVVSVVLAAHGGRTGATSAARPVSSAPGGAPAPVPTPAGATGGGDSSPPEGAFSLPPDPLVPLSVPPGTPAARRNGHAA